MAASSSSYGIEQLRKGCYYEWMSLQAKHIADLKEALVSYHRSNDDQKLRELVVKIINDFKKYAEKRSELSHRSASSYLTPSWNSSLENGLLWIGGCRPSSFIRVIYALCGSHTESMLQDRFTGAKDILEFSSHQMHKHYIFDFIFVRNLNLNLKIDENENDSVYHGGSMSDLTASQELVKINEVHMKVIADEDKITKKSAKLQENVADMPIAVAAYAMDLVDGDEIVRDALDKHEEDMAVLMEAADKLRFETLRKIVEALTPVQAAEFLLAGKRLQMSLHEWGKIREERRFGCARVEDATAAGKSKRSATC